VRLSTSGLWAAIVAAAGLGAAGLTLFDALAPARQGAENAATATPQTYVPAAPPSTERPQSAAIQPPAPSPAQPEATGSIRPPGLDSADRERAPALAAIAPEGPYRLTLRRQPGALVLTGSVPDAAAREALASHARELFFQESIVDETRLADGAPPRFLNAARFALDQLSQLSAGEAVIAGPSLSLRGEALYAQLAEEIEGKVKRKPPAGFKGAAEIRAREAEVHEGQ
jgi:OmpA-OmpF porin, OOP family